MLGALPIRWPRRQPVSDFIAMWLGRFVRLQVAHRTGLFANADRSSGSTPAFTESLPLTANTPADCRSSTAMIFAGTSRYQRPRNVSQRDPHQTAPALLAAADYLQYLPRGLWDQRVDALQCATQSVAENHLQNLTSCYSTRSESFRLRTASRPVKYYLLIS
jgi:hypothetical protein